MDAAWDERWFEACDLVSNALAHMKNEPDLEKLQQLAIKRINEMGFLQKLWMQNRFIVIIAIVLIVLILVVLKIALFPSAQAEEHAAPVAPAPAPELPRMTKDKTRMLEEDGTVLEGEIYGTMTVTEKGESLGTYNVTSNPLILGRDPNSAVVVASDTVSKTHLKVFAKGDQFYIIDLGSTNGTFVNGQKISETLVRPEDEIQLGKRGDIKLVFKKK